MADVQNYTNHKKYVVGFHGIAFGLVVIQLGLSIKALAAGLSAATVAGVAAAAALVLVAFYARTFALQVQNR